MKTLIILVVGLLAVGCGKTEPMGSGNEYNAELAIDQNTPKAEPVKELTPEEKKALRDSVVGEYKPPFTLPITKAVFLEKGIEQHSLNGEKWGGNKWSIVKGEIYVLGFFIPASELYKPNHEKIINVFRINKDKSITYIADIVDGKRTDSPKEGRMIFKRIK